MRGFSAEDDVEKDFGGVEKDTRQEFGRIESKDESVATQ